MAAQSPDALNAQTIKAQQANTKLSKTVDELSKLAAALTGGVTAQVELTNQIAQKQAELQQLETQFQEEQRRRTVEFDLALRESQLRKVTEVLTTQGKTAIDVAELNKLRSDYTALSSNFQAELDKQTSVIRQQAEASKAAAIKTMELTLAATGAEIKAQINSLTSSNQLLQAQVNDYKQQITQDREARIKEAQARGNPVVTVASGK